MKIQPSVISHQSSVKALLTRVVISALAISLPFILQTNSSVLAQSTSSCFTDTENPRVKGGLISARGEDGSLPSDTRDKFRSDVGKCIIGSGAAQADYELHTYEGLKGKFYDRSNSPAKEPKPVTSLPRTFTENKIYRADGNITVSNSPTGQGAVVVFIDGNLTIDVNLVYPPSAGNADAGGLVFVVKGDIYINKDVTRVDSVLISSGTICTAYVDVGEGLSSCTATETEQLVVNGSLISLDSAKPISFVRTFEVNEEPAEIINWQPKYLVILKDIFSETLHRWSEVE